MTDFNRLKREILKKEYYKLNDMQKEAVFKIRGPLLVLAGAGSGKTTVLVNRIANIIKFGDAFESDKEPEFLTQDDMDFLNKTLNGEVKDEQRLISLISQNPARPWEVLSITFTNKAAGEMKERLQEKLGSNAQDIWASTFHSACVKILRRDIEKLGYKKAFTIYDYDDSQRVIKGCIKELNIDDKVFSAKSVQSAISSAKDKLITPIEFEKTAGSDFKVKTYAKIYIEYQKKLVSADALDFDDIIMLTVKLFEKNPEVLEYYQNRFKYILVDEYQDTNIAQYKLVSLLADKHKNLCVVGDDDQSIYRFRGATIENILKFEHHFKNAVTIRLEQNYRSTQNILDCANKLIENNTQRKGKNLWTENNGGEKVIVYKAYDETGEAGYIARTISQNFSKGEKFSSNAVLYRVNAMSNNIETYFAKSGIPYRVIGGRRFYDRKEIKDIIAYLSIINNPEDTLRLMRIINEPKRGIGEATLNKVGEIAIGLGCTMLEIIREADQYESLSSKCGPLIRFGIMIEELTKLSTTVSLSEFIRELLDKTGYVASLLNQGEEGKTRKENIDELVSNIIKYEKENTEATLTGFLEEVSLLTDMDRLDADADAVILMTVHSAKGLEFDNVFIAGMEDGIFPGQMSFYSSSEIEEERRLAYVAITRARKVLHVTMANSRLLYGTTMRNRQSRFIDEIPKELIEVKGEGVAKANQGKQMAQTVDNKTMETAKRSDFGSNIKDSVTIDYKIGDAVLHQVFGEGLVINMTKMGNDTLVEVAFNTVGTKKVMANFAKIKKI